MKTMPKYDVTQVEQELIDQIPIAVKTKDTKYIINLLTELYTNEENGDLLSALMIIEKYLFRAYELLYFVEGKGLVFDIEEYFFDEKIHNDVISIAKKMLDSEEAERNYRAGVTLVEMGMNDQSTRMFMDSALGGSIDGAYNYGVSLSRGEGCDENKLEAAFWYWVAACRCHARACANLAMCFENGEGVCADEMTMMYWYLRSGLAGNIDAIRIAASLLIKGLGIPGQALLGSQIMTLANDSEDNETLMQIVFQLCGYLEPYIYNRYFEE